MKNNTTAISLTRKLRLLMGVPEVILSADEAELYIMGGADFLAPEDLDDEEKGARHE